MGINDWDDETRQLRPGRSRRPDDADGAPARSSSRGRDGASDGRSARARGDDRGDRSDRYDREPRPRASRRDDEWGETDGRPADRSSRGASSSSGAGRRPRDDYDEAPRRSGRSVPGRGSREGYDEEAYDRRTGRDPRDPRSGRDPRVEYPDRGGRGAPSPRSMPRGAPRPDAYDEWNPPPRTRSRAGAVDGRDMRDPRPRRPADAAPAGAQGGGLWGDGPVSARGRAIGGAVDPRGRAGASAEAAAVAAPTQSFSFGRVLGVMALAFVLGIGAAFGYHVLTTPKIPTSSGTTQPSATPATTPATTTTPHALIPIITFSR